MEFVELVRQMREAQRQYFKTRHTDALNRSKDLERRVDMWIKEQQNNQGNLL
jgi:hypothetical protein